MNVPETFFVAAAVGVDATGVVAAEDVVDVVGVDLVDVLARALATATRFLVAFFLAVVAFGVGVIDVCVVAAGVVADGLFAVACEIEVVAALATLESPPMVPCELSCGGVIDRTAPRPPTVPPAMSSARFMPTP